MRNRAEMPCRIPTLGQPSVTFLKLRVRPSTGKRRNKRDPIAHYAIMPHLHAAGKIAESGLQMFWDSRAFAHAARLWLPGRPTVCYRPRRSEVLLGKIGRETNWRKHDG